MSRKLTVFIDVDGIVADFFGGVNQVHGNPIRYEDYPPGEDNIAKVFNLPQKDFWAPVKGIMGSLEKTAEADWIIKFVNHLECCFLTSPALNAADARINWIRKHYPGIPFILTKHKHYCCAGPHNLLIDDRDKNVEDWEKAGGTSILFPRIWNKRHAEEKEYCPDRFLAELLRFELTQGTQDG